MTKKKFVLISILVFLVFSAILVSILIKPSSSFFELTLEINNTTFEVGDEVEVSAKFINHSFGTYTGTFNSMIVVILMYREGLDSPIYTLLATDRIILPFGTMKVQRNFNPYEADNYIVKAICSVIIEGEDYDLIKTELIVVE